MNFTTEVKRGLLEGVKGIPGALRAKKIEFGSPVGKYATNPYASPNMSAEKWKKNINNRFRREAGNTVRQLFSNTKPNNTRNKRTAPRVSRLARVTPRSIPKPSPYLFNTPMQFREIPSNTSPKEPELRGGRRTRKLRKYRY